MYKTSILGELIALFDTAEGKLCPILGTDTLLVPATFVRVISGERADIFGALKVTFELRHRYRDADPSDGIEAFAYLEHLCAVAEATGKAAVLSLEGGGRAEGCISECCARLEYTGEDGNIRLVTSSGELSSFVEKITLKDESIIRTRQYIYDAVPVRDRVCDGCSIGLVCSPEGAAEIRRLFGGRRCELVCAVGSLGIRGQFVLGKFTIGDSVYCELLSSGVTEYGVYDAETGSFTSYEERRDI